MGMLTTREKKDIGIYATFVAEDHLQKHACTPERMQNGKNQCAEEIILFSVLMNVIKTEDRYI